MTAGMTRFLLVLKNKTRMGSVQPSILGTSMHIKDLQTYMMYSQACTQFDFINIVKLLHPALPPGSRPTPDMGSEAAALLLLEESCDAE